MIAFGCISFHRPGSMTQESDTRSLEQRSWSFLSPSCNPDHVVAWANRESDGRNLAAMRWDMNKKKFFFLHRGCYASGGNCKCAELFLVSKTVAQVAKGGPEMKKSPKLTSQRRCECDVNSCPNCPEIDGFVLQRCAIWCFGHGS